MTNKIMVAMAGNDEDGTIYKIDAIEHDGKLWLVPRWLESPATAVSMPARLVRFDNQRHQKTPGGKFGDFVLNVAVPKVLLGPTTPKQQVDGWEYLELPELQIPASIRPLKMTGK